MQHANDQAFVKAKPTFDSKGRLFATTETVSPRARPQMMALPEQRQGLPRMTRKVFLVVAGRLFRDGLRSLMQESGLTVVGHCETLAEATTLVDANNPPDLFLVGAHGTPLVALQTLREQVPSARWILLCVQAQDHMRMVVGSEYDWVLFQDVSAEILHHVMELMLLGHSLPKDRILPSIPAPPTPTPSHPAAETQPAKGAVETPIPAPVIVPSRMQPTAAQSRPVGDQTRPVHLSDRETEILQCLVNGASNKAIARDLCIAEATVKVHVKGLLRKMQLQNRTQAAIWAVSHAAGALATPPPYDRLQSDTPPTDDA